PEHGAERQERGEGGVVAVGRPSAADRERHGAPQHDRPPGLGGGDVPTLRIQGHGPGPKGEGSPSLPGLRMPFGSSAAFIATSTPCAGPSASATNRARLIPIPWWWERFPPAASTARWPASHSAMYVDSIASGGGVAANVKYKQAPSRDRGEMWEVRRTAGRRR